MKFNFAEPKNSHDHSSPAMHYMLPPQNKKFYLVLRTATHTLFFVSTPHFLRNCSKMPRPQM